jgi:hypothetical protein
LPKVNGSSLIASGFPVTLRALAMRNHMKKLLLPLLLVTVATQAHSQGTIAFGNSVGTAIKFDSGGGLGLHNMTAAEQAFYNIAFGVCYGPPGTTPTQLAPGTGVIGTTAGVFASLAGNNVLGLYAIPGTSPDGGTVVSLQIKAWNTVTGQEYMINSTPRDVTLGPAAGPAAVIWQGATATSPNRFLPILFLVPEPSTVILGALGLGSMLVFRRSRKHG